MGTSRGRTVVAIAVCLLWLSGCESSTRLGDPFQAKPDAPQGVSSAPDASAPGAPSGEDPSSTGSVQHGARDAGAKRSAGKESDDVSLGKNYFNAGKFSLAERHFRRALELHPRDLDS